MIRLIKIRKLRWLGHVMQMNDHSRKTLERLDKPIGKLGRPRTRYMENIENDLRVELEDGKGRRLIGTNGYKF